MPSSKRPEDRMRLKPGRSNVLPMTRSDKSAEKHSAPSCFTNEQALSLKAAEAIITIRALRNEVFPPYFQAERAWDIALVVYYRSISGERISVTSLTEEIGAPHATACRWIESLAQRGLLTLEPDHLDARRKFVSPTEQLLQRMEVFLGAIQKLGLIGP